MKLSESLTSTLAATVVWCALPAAAAPAAGPALPDELTLKVGEVGRIGTDVEIVLTKRSMRSADFICGIWTDEGFKRVTFPVSTYRGYVKNDPLVYVDANIEPGGILNVNFTENRGTIAQIRDLKVDVGSGASTPTMSTGNKVVPVSSLKQRQVPTPGGDLVPLVPMRQYQWIITVPGFFMDKHDPETLVSKVEQRWNAGDFAFARDVGTCWEIDVLILVDPKSTKPVDWSVVCPENPERQKNHMMAYIKPEGTNTGKNRSLGVVGLGLEAGILMHEGAHIHGNPWHQLDAGDGLFGGNPFFGETNVAVLLAEQKNRGEEEYKGAIYNGRLPPRAAFDFASTRKDVPVTVDVLDNDYSGKGTALALEAVGPESERGGDVKRIADGPTLVYTPPPGFVGVDELCYTVADSEGVGSRSGRVKVEVHGDGLCSHYDFETVEKQGLEWLKERKDWRLWVYGTQDKRPDAEKVIYVFDNRGPFGGRGYAQWLNYAPVPGVRGNGLLNPVGCDRAAQVDLVGAGGDPGRGSFSVSIWVAYAEGSKGGAILCKSPYGFKTIIKGWAIARDGEGFRFVGNTIRVRSEEQFELNTKETIEPDRWYHLVMVIDRQAKKLRAYVNNVEVTTSRGSATIPDGVIEYHSPMRLFNGYGWKSWGAAPALVDELKTFSVALTPAQVAELYAEGKDAKPPALPSAAP